MTKESDIQREILDWLRMQYPRAFIRKVPLGPSLQGMGAKAKNPLAGFPDIMMIYRGEYIGLEVKKPGEKLGPYQVKMHEELEDAGGYVRVVHSLEEVQRLIKGIIHLIDLRHPAAF